MGLVRWTETRICQCSYFLPYVNFFLFPPYAIWWQGNNETDQIRNAKEWRTSDSWRSKQLYILSCLAGTVDSSGFCNLHHSSVSRPAVRPREREKTRVATSAVPTMASPYGLTFTWWGCCSLCPWHKPTELAHSFLFCCSACFFLALSPVFHSINSPDISVPSDSPLPVLFLPST